MDKKPLVSVLMGIYNCADTLEEAVDCIVNQTYDNWELIMCDDCSSDNTNEVAERIAQKDNRIKVIKNEKNLTLAPTLNHCFEEAKGEYIARMDGDDICDNNRFEREVEVLNNHPEYAVVSCGMRFYDENGVYGEIINPERPKGEDFVRQSPICHAPCMMRADVLIAVGGYSNSKEVERIEDYDLWVRMYAEGYKAYNIQEPLYSMREGRDAIKRKRFKFRVTEYKLRKRVCKQFNLGWKDRIIAFRPILIGFMPPFVYSAVHRKKYKNL
jgi:glycosyltransferase EpsE